MSGTPEALWYTRCSIPTPLGLAAQLGWLRDEFDGDGIAIKSLQESTDPKELASHFEHTLPHSFRYGGSSPAIWARARGQETRVIGISWIDEYQAILALPESGIRSAADLRGRRLGLPKRRGSGSQDPGSQDNGLDVARAASLRGFLTALELGGLNYDDAEFVDLTDNTDAPVQAPATAVRRPRRHSYTRAALALARGEVDAIYVKDVRGAETAHLLGARVVVDIGAHSDPQVRINYCAPRPLTVNTATVRDYPQLVERLLGRVVDVGHWAASHPAETIAQIARDTGWAEHWVRFAYGENVHRHLQTTLSEQSVRGLESYKNFLLRWGFIEADFSIGEWIDPQPLAAVQRLR